MRHRFGPPRLYDADGNLITVDAGDTASYYYDSLNNRVRMNRPVQGNYEFVFDTAGRRVSAWGLQAATATEVLIYGDSKSPIATQSSGSTNFLHYNWVGTKRAITIYNGDLLGTVASLPFGDAETFTGSNDDWIGFAGMDDDLESGTEHAQFRQYEQNHAHWMSPDPYYGSYDFTNPQSFNRYAYALNNPVALNDPTGECSEITAGINQSPWSASGQALIALASQYGANVAFPYAGQNSIASFSGISGALFGANGGATQTASAALGATISDGGGNGVFSLGFSGGAQANVSAGLTSIDGGAYAGNAAFYDPGLGLGYSPDIAGIQDYTGSGFTSSLVNDLSGGYPDGDIDVAGCGHDVSCAIENNTNLQDQLDKAGPCLNPRVFWRGGHSTPLSYFLPPNFGINPWAFGDAPDQGDNNGDTGPGSGNGPGISGLIPRF